MATEDKPLSWMMIMCIDTDDDAAMYFRGEKYCHYAKKFNHAFFGTKEECLADLKQVLVEPGMKFSTTLQTLLEGFLAGILLCGEDEEVNISYSGNQDVDLCFQREIGTWFQNTLASTH